MRTGTRLGLLVRLENRGLGIQTWELWRHLRPEVTIAVRNLRGYPKVREYPERFPGALLAEFNGQHLEPYDEVRKLLDTCDVVLSVETPYDFRLLEDLRARTAVVGNREFLDWLVDPDLPWPDLFIAPSTWRLDEWPPNTTYLPHPVDRTRLPFTERGTATTFLHLVAPAMRDRAGTRLVLEASRLLRAPRVTIVARAQHRRYLPTNRRKGPSVRMRVADVDNYWEAYAGADVLVAPRRYGGQSLPLVEAQSLGMPVIALDREPERQLLPPEALVKAYRAEKLETSGGEIGVWGAKPQDLAAKITELARDPDLVRKLSRDGDHRAAELSWDALGPRWLEVLGDLAA